MSWRARLALMRSDTGQKRSDGSLTKLTEPPFVGFVSRQHGRLRPNRGTEPNTLRAELLALVAAVGLDPALVYRLSPGDLRACVGLPDAALRAYIRALHTDAERMAGRVPPDETAAGVCVRCGPVWLAPEVAAVLPVVNGLPRALGCAWCHVRKAGRHIPRPRVTCGTCAHFQRDTVNPEGGAGHCGLHPDDAHRMHWPAQRHGCANWNL